MMCRKKDGNVFGVSNDYDLAIFASNNHSPSSKTCTGTQPSMAIDLLGHPTNLTDTVTIWSPCSTPLFMSQRGTTTAKR
jgi:hypothetical protein